MKKTIKLSDKHADLVRQNMNSFKNEILKNLAEDLYKGGTTKPATFSKAFVQAGWTRSA